MFTDFELGRESVTVAVVLPKFTGVTANVAVLAAPGAVVADGVTVATV
jgi:hypothetical protein